MAGTGRARPSANGKGNVRTLNVAATAPVDLDALLVAEREAHGMPPVVWRGRTWEVQWDFAFVELQKMVAGDVLGGLAAIFGADVLSLDPPVGVREAGIVIRSLQVSYGIGPGESSGS